MTAIIPILCAIPAELQTYMKPGSFGLDILRLISYWILQGLAKLVDSIAVAITKLTSVDFLQSEEINQLINQFAPLTWIILLITVMAAALIIIMKPGANRSQMLSGIFISVILIVATPFIFQAFGQLKTAAVADLGFTGDQGPGTIILQKSIIDLDASVADGSKVTLSEDNDPFLIDINERLETEEPFNQKITGGTAEHPTYEDLDTSHAVLPFLNEYLYKYHLTLLPTLIMLAGALIALFFAGFKIARLFFDLVFKRIVAAPVFASDMGSGRAKQFFKDLASTYIVLALVLLLVRMYLDLCAFISASDMDYFVKILLSCGCAWGLIDGPDIIVKLLGIDAGVKSAMAPLMAVMSVGKGIKSAGKMGMAAASKAVHAPGNIAGGVSKAAGSMAQLPASLGSIQKNFTEARKGQSRPDYTPQAGSGERPLSAFEQGKRSSANTASRIGHLAGVAAGRMTGTRTAKTIQGYRPPQQNGGASSASADPYDQKTSETAPPFKREAPFQEAPQQREPQTPPPADQTKPDPSVKPAAKHQVAPDHE